MTLTHPVRSEETRVSLPGGVGYTRRLLKHPLMTVTVLFAVSRITYFVSGIRFDMSPLRGGRVSSAWQLDPNLLQHHLIASIWDLNSQPPLFNLYCGLLLKVPVSMQETVAATTFIAFGLVMVLSTSAIMVDLHVPTGLALVVTAVVIVDPSFVLYENWLSYGYPCAALLTFAALCLLRFARLADWRWGFGFFAASAGVVLLDSSFQYVWLLTVCVTVIVFLRRYLRSLVLVALIPLMLVGIWAAKDAVQFGTYTTSSWLGMNLTKTTLIPVEANNIRTLVRAHKLSPLATIQAFSPVSAYVPRWASLPHTGSPALDEVAKSTGQPNYNNLVYVQVSKQYFREDLAFIRAHPGLYVIGVEDAAKLATVPPDEYSFLSGNRSHIVGWSRAFDFIVLWQPTNDLQAGTNATYLAEGPFVSQLSYGFILLLFLTIVGTPPFIWRWRRSDPAASVTLTFIWVTVAYLIVTTSLIEFGENERYAMDLGPLPIIGASVVVAAGARFWKRRSGREERVVGILGLNR